MDLFKTQFTECLSQAPDRFLGCLPCSKINCILQEPIFLYLPARESIQQAWKPVSKCLHLCWDFQSSSACGEHLHVKNTPEYKIRGNFSDLHLGITSHHKTESKTPMTASYSSLLPYSEVYVSGQWWRQNTGQCRTWVRSSLSGPTLNPNKCNKKRTDILLSDTFQGEKGG